MERLGVSLVEVIKRNALKFSYVQIISFGCQMLDALESLHELGFVHCDIKPDNILFGLARSKKRKSSILKANGPEQEEEKK
jgi:casein kinase 1/casein kinase I family protein HRR25